MVNLQPAFLASSATASTKHVLFLTLQSGRVGEFLTLGEWLRMEPGRGQRGHQRQKDPQSPQTHRHTYTSRGGRVLGVIIQGATRNTTVSVKIGDSEKSCRGGAEWTALASESRGLGEPRTW